MAGGAMYMIKKMLFSAAFLLAILSGCNANENREAGYKGETKDGTTLISHKPGKAVNDNNDAVEQPSDQLLNTPGSNSNVEPDAGSEVEKARAVVKENTEYEAGSVWQKGRTLSVTIQDNGKIHSDKERRNEKARVKRLLTQALPRYNIQVKMETGND
jgi:hypothetical protein